MREMMRSELRQHQRGWTWGVDLRTSSEGWSWELMRRGRGVGVRRGVLDDLGIQ